VTSGEKKIRRAKQIGDMKSPLQSLREERFLSAQADAFAGAKAEEKVGLLRSK